MSLLPLVEPRSEVSVDGGSRNLEDETCDRVITAGERKHSNAPPLSVRPLSNLSAKAR